MDHSNSSGGSYISDGISTDQQKTKMRKAPMIMSIIVVIILLSASLSTWYIFFRGPTDPYAGYEAQVEGFFNSGEGIVTKGVVNHHIGYRNIPYGSITNVDRLYVGCGSGSTFTPYGIYAYDRDFGQLIWNSGPFETESSVSTSIVVTNFGGNSDPHYMETRIIFGCEDGKLYVLKDEFQTPRSEFPPYDNFEWSIQLDGAISGVAVYVNESIGYDENDIIITSTDTGHLYAFSGMASHPVSTTLLWSLSIGDYGLTQPTISSDGKYIFVGSKDGKLWGLMALTGQQISGWNGPYEIPSHQWSTPPVAFGNPPIIYITTEDGYLFSINGIDGSERNGWGGGKQVLNSQNVLDGGKLTKPMITKDGNTIIFGSSSGHVYCYDSNGILKTDFDSTFGGALDTECTVTPFYDERFTKYLFFTVTCFNETPTNPSDDFTHFYSVDEYLNVSYRLTLNGIVENPPVVYYGSRIRLNFAEVVIVTVNVDNTGALSSGRIYSFNYNGKMIPK